MKMLLKTALVLGFSSGDQATSRRANKNGLCLFWVAVVIYVFLSTALAKLPVSSNLPSNLLYALLVVSVEVATIVGYFGVTNLLGIKPGSRQLSSLLSTLPITDRTINIVIVSPLLVLLLIMNLAALPFIVQLSSTFASPFAIILCLWVVATLAGVAFLCLQLESTHFLARLILPGLVLGQCLVCWQYFFRLQDFTSFVPLVVVIMIQLLVISAFLTNILWGGVKKAPNHLTKKPLQFGEYITSSAWFSVKAVRSQRARSGNKFVLLLLVAASLLIYFKLEKAPALMLAYWVAYTLPAFAVLDYRSLSKKWKPPEIYSVSGLIGYVKQLTIVSALWAAFICTILMATLGMAHYMEVNILPVLSAAAILSSAIGLMVGCLLTASGNSVVQQFTAALLTTVLLGLSYKMVPYRGGLSPIWLSWCGSLTICSLTLLSLTEQWRIKKYGRIR